MRGLSRDSQVATTRALTKGRQARTCGYKYNLRFCPSSFPTVPVEPSCSGKMASRTTHQKGGTN
jgi:hypothetical protein